MNVWRRAYTFIAVQLLNTLLMFAALNLIVILVAAVFDRPPATPAPTVIDPGVDRNAYSAMPPDQIQRFLEEQSGMQLIGFQYEPWVLFRNPEYHGRFLNMNARGLRRTKSPRTQCPNPLRIFVFGSSTTFGYGVADEYTLPSLLQTHLERRYPTLCLEVSNYGQGYFYSSQELQQLMGLLKEGQVPDWGSSWTAQTIPTSYRPRGTSLTSRTPSGRCGTCGTGGQYARDSTGHGCLRCRWPAPSETECGDHHRGRLRPTIRCSSPIPNAQEPTPPSDTSKTSV